ncbi:DUF11 domain-containing protein [Microbulbifer salipaludis]|uniref:DUF11 domain-containing protein n=1 Tax=Microbulbifer salipaludis TaxID=187980 RepID=A0ABS3E537_9GAMM|nr:DUF11 domain-containing protein [Microbulbifer salipaludis]MBN8430367.1 DUF11 domain-containing protein [Microbulbifer salipaludis]
MFTKKLTFYWAVIGLLAVGVSPLAFAAGTTAGDTVSNTATVSYQVGGVDQADVDSNEATFTVDRVIRMTLDQNDSPVLTVPGATAIVTSYTLTNTSNDILDFSLSAANVTTGTSTGFGADSIDGAAVAVYVDNGDGVFNAADDTSTSVDNLDEDGTATIFVVLNVPSTAIDGDILGVLLGATALDSDGSVLSETSGANTAGIDTVFGDLSGAVDSNGDAQITVYGAYEVGSATLSVAKSSTVISDPFNGTTDPKSIPGAVIEYCIVVENSGSTDADTVEVNDPLPTETTYVAGSVMTGTGAACDSSATDTGFGSTSGTPVDTVTASFGTVTSTSAVWVSFQVILN